MQNFPTTRGDILIVDDIPENLTILTNILSTKGYSIRPAINGSIALKAARHIPPDLILLDIMMPGMDGYEVCRQLKADERTRDVPILFISALDEVWNKIKAFEIGGVDYVAKPFDAGEVLARVETHLALRQMQQQLQAQNIQLQQEIQERKRMTRELAFMNEMSSLLQQCQNEAETYRVIANSCKQLFASDSGYVALKNETGTMLQQVAGWGNYPVTQIFPVEVCQILQEENSLQNAHHAESLCARFSDAFDSTARCLALPISTAEEILGVFSIILSQNPEQPLDEQAIAAKWMMANGVVEHYALALANIRLREMLRVEAIRDPLTGLFNRRYMEESLQREVRRAERHGTSIGIIMLDIDLFKVLNDTHGHDAGDVVLQQLGILLGHTIRGGDIACRYGGEEFLLILPDVLVGTIEERAASLLDHIGALEIHYQQQLFTITVSIGVSLFPEHGENVQTVVHAADDALYQAKHNGRNQVVLAAAC